MISSREIAFPLNDVRLPNVQLALCVIIMGRPRMFASLPFILLLILQGFARQDCAEFLFGNQDLVHAPSQVRSLKAFDELFIQFSLVGQDRTSHGVRQSTFIANSEENTAQFIDDSSCPIESGFLEVQRSRDGPIA
jgi:hypothetical protein